MPITCRQPLTPLTRREFASLSYDLFGDVLAIRKELGSFFEDKHYKKALALRRKDVLLEAPVKVGYRTFEKTYFLDVLLAHGAIIEFKATDSLTSRHKAQLIHYQMLTRLECGMLINVRPEQVVKEYVNCPSNYQERFGYRISSSGWNDEVSGARLFKNILVELIADWGSCLELALYEQAVTHFLGGEEQVLKPVAVQLNGAALGTHLLRMAADRVAFKLTALDDPVSQERFADHAKRLIIHTGIDAMLWANINRREITFRTLKT